MSYLLDNPIWHGLVAANAPLGLGNEEARFFLPTVAPHAGLRENSRQNLEQLYQLLPPGQSVTLFADVALHIAATSWTVRDERPLHQLLYEGPAPGAASPDVRRLGVAHVPAMLALANLASPGPFRENTLALGGYHGLFQGEELVAMAGYRFQPGSYVEISAVCTHTAHLGRGHAATVVRSLLQAIMAEGRSPFLHVSPRNDKALHLYQKLGFRYRRTLTLYALQRH